MKHTCQYCNRPTTNPGANAAHERCCLKNPNRVKHTRSPNAGQQKGSTPWNKGKKTGTTSRRKSLGEIAVAESTYSRSHLRVRLINENIIPYECTMCGIGPEWNGKPMPLVLDHINGVNNDHRLENLRFVCSNCDCQLPTYKSKNRKASKNKT